MSGTDKREQASPPPAERPLDPSPRPEGGGDPNDRSDNDRARIAALQRALDSVGPRFSRVLTGIVVLLGAIGAAYTAFSDIVDGVKTAFPSKANAARKTVDGGVVHSTTTTEGQPTLNLKDIK